MTLSGACLLLAASLAAGFVNAIAGGGSLLTFPALTAIGLPHLVANATNTVALTPGYLGAILGQRRDLLGQKARLRHLLPVAVAGGLAGGWLLLHSDPSLFRRLVPWLILGGSALLALQDPLRRWLERRQAMGGIQTAISTAAGPADEAPASYEGGLGLLLAVLAASVYGGYFGAGLSVILVAVLAIGLNDSLPRLNGLKQPIALASNLTAALLFAVGGPVQWPPVALMAAGAWLGGLLGGRCASRVDPRLLRRLVVTAGGVIGLVYLLR